MAVIQDGITRCSLCDECVMGDQDYVGFPHFLPIGHRFSFFSDAAIHQACFSSWKSGPEMKRLHQKFEGAWVIHKSDPDPWKATLRASPDLQPPANVVVELEAVLEELSSSGPSLGPRVDLKEPTAERSGNLTIRLDGTPLEEPNEYGQLLGARNFQSTESGNLFEVGGDARLVRGSLLGFLSWASFEALRRE